MRRGWWLLALLAGLVIGAGAENWRSSARPFERAQDGGEAELRELRVETRRLREAVAELQKQAQAKDSRSPTPPRQLEGFAQAAAVSDQPPPPPSGPGAELSQQQQRDETLSYAAYLDDHLAASSRDEKMGEQLTAKLEALLVDGSEVLDLRCGTDLCRVTTRHPDSAAYRRFQSRAFQAQERLWSGPASFVVLEKPEAAGEPLVSAMYLGRGQQLPSPDPAR